MQRKANLVEILGLLIGVASLALALGEEETDSIPPIASQSRADLYHHRYEYRPPPATPRHRYYEYYEPCDEYYYECGRY